MKWLLIDADRPTCKAGEIQALDCLHLLKASSDQVCCFAEVCM